MTRASGQQLNAKGIVMMNILVDSTRKACSIPCYIIDSDEPLWSGALKDCGLLMNQCLSGTWKLTPKEMKSLPQRRKLYT